MPTEPITLLKGNEISNLTDYRDALPQNMYAVIKPILGAQGHMLCYPGLTLYTTGSGADRGAMYNERQGYLFRVSGTKLIHIATDGTVTELGTVPGTSQAAMAYSFNSQAVVVNENMYLYGSGVFSKVTDPDLGNPLDIIWINGVYFLTDGEYIYHTDLIDESAIDPLKFATAEFMPDPSLGVGKTRDNKAIVFGRYTIEYFVDTATRNFAYTRIETRAIKKGIVATHAKCEINDIWFIVGGSREEALAAYIIKAGVPIKISTREIDKILAIYTEPELIDMRMEVRIEDNVTFILIHLPNETLCFNETVANLVGIEGAWSTLKSGVADIDNYRAINGVFDARVGKWIYGDKNTPKIGELDNTKFTHYDLINEWILYTPFLNLETFSIDEIDLETISGHNTTDDAKVAISLTYDGFSFGREWFMDYGEPLKYSQRFIIRRLGYVSDWCGLKFRGATTSRMSFALFKMTYS